MIIICKLGQVTISLCAEYAVITNMMVSLDDISVGCDQSLRSVLTAQWVT